jgi:carboxylate-amine ligase
MEADRWRARFDAGADFTVGLEEELMLLHPETLAPLPEAPRAVAELAAPGRRYRTELPASQIELVTPPFDAVGDAVASLADGRADMASGVAGWARLAGSGVHPCCGPEGPLVDSPRYHPIIEEYGPIVRYEQVYGLHVHVGLRGADRVLAIFNALRSHLPEIAALAGNGPFVGGEDSGLASVRPKLAELLPRQGVPPVIPSYEYLEELTRWGAVSGTVPDGTHLWWEARLHPDFPTIEVRVADQQTTVGESAAVAGFVVGLIAWLAERHDAGEPLAVHDPIRIGENRWRALRHGLRGTLLDLDTGEPSGTRDVIRRRIAEIAEAAARAGAGPELERARDLVEFNGSERQRAIAAEHGVPGVVRHLADVFLESP